MYCGIGVLLKNLYFNSALLYPFFACKKGTIVLETSVHSKLKQLPVKTNPGQQKHIQMIFSKYIGRWRSCKSQRMKECLNEQNRGRNIQVFRSYEIPCFKEKAILNSLQRKVQPLPKAGLLQSQYSFCLQYCFSSYLVTNLKLQRDSNNGARYPDSNLSYSF